MRNSVLEESKKVSRHPGGNELQSSLEVGDTWVKVTRMARCAGVVCPDVRNYKWQHNQVWYRMCYSCTHMATVGVKGLMFTCNCSCTLHPFRNDVMKHRTGRTGPKYRSWVLVKCVWCGAYYWFRLRKLTVYGFHAFLTCILLLLLLIQCKISLYLGPVRCFVTPFQK